MVMEIVAEIGIAMCVVCIMTALVVSYVVALFIMAKRSLDKSKIQDFYLNTVVAYKVGLIHKKSKENDIELIYPLEKDEFINELESDVKSDLELDVLNAE